MLKPVERGGILRSDQNPAVLGDVTVRAELGLCVGLSHRRAASSRLDIGRCFIGLSTFSLRSTSAPSARLFSDRVTATAESVAVCTADSPNCAAQAA